MALSTPPTAPQRGDRATFASRVDAFITWLIGFVSELNNFSAQMNTIASGGAYAIPYTWGTGGGAGLLNVGGGPPDQYLATSLDISNISASGQDISPLLMQFDQSTSTVKGYIRIVHVADPALFMVFAVTSRTSNASPAYQWVQGSMVEATAVNPFSLGDSVLLYFDRTGDKGDTSSLTNVLWVRDQKASGTDGGASIAGVQTRTLNTTVINTIPGASLSGNQVTLPAGTYRITGLAPANSVTGHQSWVYSVTDSAVLFLGQSAYTANAAANNSLATIAKAQLTLTGTKVLELRHWTAAAVATNGLGRSSGSGQGEVYADMFIEKVA